MQSVQGNSYFILKCVLILHLVSCAYSTCNSTHINYCNRVNRPSSYSYTVYNDESVQQTYTETYHYKCGFRDWYTCTGNRSRNYSSLVPVTETVYFNTTLRECCDDNATCKDEENFDLRFVSGHSTTSYDTGIIQICLEGLWRYIEYGITPYNLCINHRWNNYRTYTTSLHGTDPFVQFSFKSGETNIRYIDYTFYTSGTRYYLDCTWEYLCTGGCANGQCTGREKCTCNSGYTGKNCDIATCPSCVHGQCTGPNSCSCHTGWTGSNCNTAVCSQGCVNGVCALPDACQCNQGYTGDTCNIPVSDFIEHPVPSLNNTAGKTITLSCSVVETESTNQLKWIFVRNTTETELSASSDIDISNSVNGAGTVSVSNLTISDIDLSNAGTYACLHRHTYSTTTRVDIEYPVNVTVYPDTIIAPTSVVEQTFICKGYGYPLPELEWISEDAFGLSLNDDNYTIIERTEVSPLGYKIAVSELIITYYDNTTIGKYICQGYNNVTNLIEAIDEATVNFYLEEPPIVELNSPPTVVMLINESINISSTVYFGLPEAVNITWTFQLNDSLPVVLESTSTIQISNDLLSVFIPSLDYLHEGVYTLTLCNRVECSYDSIELIVDAPPTISTIVSSDMGVVSPAEISIYCVASIGKPVPLVQWIFNDRIIGMGYGSNNITFNVTSFEDGGQYTCIAENIHGITNKSLTITVQDTPMFYDNPLDEEALIGGHIELSCTASGYPKPGIQWIKDGIAITVSNDSMKFNFSIELISETDSTAVLYIADLDKNDIGYYSCQANNSLVEDLSVVSATGYLDILYPPNVDKELSDITKVVNETVMFSCNFSGNPLPIVQWKRDGLDLDDLENRTIYISTTNISNYTVESTLTLVNLSKEDEGTYSCVGINKVSGILKSNDTSSGFLTILVPPYLIDTPHSSTAAPVGDNITLECIVGGFPLPNITWMRIDPQDGSSLVLLEAIEDEEMNKTYDQTIASSRIQLNNLQLNDTAIYRCIGTNILGNITHDTHLTVEFPANVTLYPEVLIAPEVNITDSFTCEGYGIPLPVLTWYSVDGELGLENVTITVTNETLSTGIQVATSVLTFHEFTNITEGLYRCSGYNNVTDYIGVNNSAVGEFILATKPSIDSDYPNITGIEEDSITLDFKIVYAAPVVEYEDIYWTFTPLSGSVIMDWNELNADERIEFSEDRLNMTIYNLTYNDAGIFNITATNREGTGYVLIELIIEGEPNIDYVSADKEVVSPTTELIECVTSGNPDPLVEWVFQNETLTSLNSSYFINNRTINITSVRDAGVYSCVASNGYGKVSSSLNITVQDPSVIVMNPNDTNGTVFDSTTLSCTAYGYPIPQIQWLKNGSLIVVDNAMEDNVTSSGDHEEEGSGSMKYIIWTNSTIGGIYEITGYLTIVNLSHTDRGQYQCMASNSLVIDTVNTSLPATVDVMYPPNVFQTLINVTVNTSDTLSLYCSISGHPIPNITWWFKQQDSSEDRIIERISVESMECIQYSSYDECQQSLLTVVNVNKSDTGTYTCRGVNTIPDINGVYTNFTSAYVFVQVPPIVMLASEPIIEAIVGHDEYVLINFIVSDDIPSVQPNKTIWYKTNTTGTFELPLGDGKYRFNMDRTLLNITNLQYTDRGNYTMTAKNEAGVDEATITLYLEVEPLLLSKTRTNTIIDLDNGITNVYFSCSADGIPVPVLQWYKDGSLLLNISRYLITYTTNNITDTIRSDFIPEIQLAHSSLNLSKLRKTDNGTYECRADNSAGETKVVYFHLNVIDTYVPICGRSESDNICNNKGTCIDTGRDMFFCDCEADYTGTTCDTRVVIEVAAVITKIESSIDNDVGEVVTPPTNVAGFLFQPLTLTCHAAGIPIPKVVWKSRNESFMVNGSSLTFEEMRLSDRGFYKCNVSNKVSNKLNSEQSEEIQVYIPNIYQYRVGFNTTGSQTDDPLPSLRQALSGSLFPDKQTQVLSIDLISIGNTNKRSIVSDILTMVTIQSKENGSNALASALFDHMITRLEQKAVLVKPYDDELPDRFDGCKSDDTLVPSVSNETDEDFKITWPEINLGESVTLPCPCGGLDLQSSKLVATRKCGGNYSAGAKWEEPNIQPCNFTDKVRALCLLATKEPVTRVNSLGNLTENTSEFQNTEVTVSVAVLLSAIANVTGERMSTESFLNVINNLLGSSEDVRIESQSTANTSGRLLEALEVVASGLSNNYTEEDILIPFDSFVVFVKAFNSTTPPSTYTVKAFNNGTNDITICTTEQLLCQSQQNASAEVTLPSAVFDYFDNNSSTNGVTTAVFVNNALFLRRDKMHREVSSVIVSVSVVGADSITGLESPVELVFQMSRSSKLENASDPVCSFWDPTLDDNYGDWSSVGCELVSIDNITNSSDDVLFTCHCNHLTSFTVLMDVSYKEVEPPKTHFDFVLSVYTFIGCIISTVCLIVAVISHLVNKKLRRSEHGLLVVNLSLSLIGVYGTFIGAVYAVHIPVVCIVVAALLQYFFLVAFLIMTVEAIELYRKTVRVFVSKHTMEEFTVKIFISCWVLPLFIVGFCLAPDYGYYISKKGALCRAQQIPFYIGTIVPFCIIYIFNWVMFILIFVSIVKRSVGVSTSASTKAEARLKMIKHRFRTAVVLSVIFGLGWGLGLPATQAQDNDILRYVFSIGFNTLTAFQGTMLFFLHCVNSKEVRKEWRQWFSVIFKKKGIMNTSFSNPSQQKNFKAEFQESNTNLTSVSHPSSTMAIVVKTRSSVSPSDNNSTDSPTPSRDIMLSPTRLMRNSLPYTTQNGSNFKLTVIENKFQ